MDIGSTRGRFAATLAAVRRATHQRGAGATFAAGAAFAGAALLAACSGGGDGRDEGVSPLQGLFGSPESFAAEELKVQEHVATCMAAKGFQYTPLDPSRPGAFQTLDFGSEDFVKENGFGISTFVGRPPLTVQINDPNAEYRNSLSPANQEAYTKALFGDIQAFSPDGEGGGGVRIIAGAVGGGGEIGGCMGEANKAIRGDRPAFDQDLATQLVDIGKKVESDPRILKANEAWAQCMAKAGYTYANEEAARAYIQQKTKALTGDDNPGVAFQSASGGGMVISRVVVSGGGEGAQPTPTPSYDTRALAQLQDEERKLATASGDCRKKHVDPVRSKVRHEYEQEFVEAHPELEGKGGN